MEKLYEIKIQLEMECVESEVEYKELSDEWKEYDAPTREIKEQSAQYGEKPKALMAQPDSIRSRQVLALIFRIMIALKLSHLFSLLE